MSVSISVVVPVYNVEPYIKQCLESLYDQKLKGLEIVLVNDGSTDNSLSICEEYARKFDTSKIINKSNGGLSDARNVGTEAATGDYIYYLDSDDWLASDALRTLYNFAIKNDCEIVQGGFYYAYDDHLLFEYSRKFSQILAREEAMLELIKNDYIKNFAWGKLYRADIVKKHQFPKGRYYEDSYWQHLIINECTQYGVVYTPIYYYRQRSTGISGEFSIRNMDLLKGNEERLVFIHEKYPEYEKDMIVMLWHLSYSMLRTSEQIGENLLENEYRDYWEEFNQKYEFLLSKYLASDMQFILYRTFPGILPIFDFYNRIRDRLKPSKRYKTIKFDNAPL